MIRLLFFLFRKSFLKLAFSNQGKPASFDKMQFAFIDSDGKKYYRFINDEEIPILRKGKLELHLKELQMGLSSDNLSTILEYMEMALGKGMKPDLPRIGHAIIEMRNRKELLLHPDILFDLVSTLYIREDENPAKIDLDIHSQKTGQFKKDSAGGLYDFFYSAGLSTYIPYLPQLKEGFEGFYQRQMEKIAAFDAMMNQYSSARK